MTKGNLLSLLACLSLPVAFESTANERPTVSSSISSTFKKNQSVTGYGSASDPDGSIKLLGFHLYNMSNGGAKVTSGSDRTYPYSYNFGVLPPGNYRLWVRAVDNEGQIDSGGSSSYFTVLENQRPTVSSSIASSFKHDQTVVGYGSASDPDGSIRNLGFHLYTSSGTKITSGSDYSAPYSYNFGKLAAGSYRLWVRAVDNDGQIDSGGSSSYFSVAANRAPNASNLNASVSEDSQVDVNVLASSSDPDSDSMSISSASGASNGSVSVVSNRVRYTPNSNYCGSDSFNYTVRDSGGLTDTARVNVSVSCVNDKPVITGQKSLSLNENTSLTLSINDFNVSDPDSSNLTLNVATGSNYTLSGTTITPSENFHGNLTVTVSVSDGSHTSSAFNTSINVQSVNERPTVSVEPVADVKRNQEVVVRASGSDPDGSIAYIGFHLYDGSGTKLLSVPVRSAPYEYNFGVLESGDYRVVVRAEDNEGQVDDGAAVTTFTVLANQRPTVSAEDIADVFYGQDVLVSGDATDPDGSIKYLGFHLYNMDNNGEKVTSGSDTSAPYTYTFSNLEPANYRVVVRAEDNEGQIDDGAAEKFFTVKEFQETEITAYYEPAIGKVGQEQTYYLSWTNASSCNAVSDTNTQNNIQPQPDGVTTLRDRVLDYEFRIECVNSYDGSIVTKPVHLKVEPLDTPTINYSYNKPTAMLNWQAIQGANNYVVERALDGNDWEELAALTSTAFSETFTAKSRAEYRVKACLVEACSLSSNIAVFQRPTARIDDVVGLENVNTTISVSASADIDEGYISHLVFSLYNLDEGNVKVTSGSDYSYPFTFEFENVKAGNYRIIASATSNLGVSDEKGAEEFVFNYGELPAANKTNGILAFPKDKLVKTGWSSEAEIGDVIVADINGDGVDDVSFYNEQNLHTQLLNEHGDLLCETDCFISIPLQASVEALIAVDINSDGAKALISYNFNSNDELNVVVYSLTSSNHFEINNWNYIFDGALPNKNVVGDFNGDGNQDLALYSETSGVINLRLLLSDADGSEGFVLTEEQQISISGNYTQLPRVLSLDTNNLDDLLFYQIDTDINVTFCRLIAEPNAQYGIYFDTSQCDSTTTKNTEATLNYWGTGDELEFLVLTNSADSEVIAKVVDSNNSELSNSRVITSSIDFDLRGAMVGDIDNVDGKELVLYGLDANDEQLVVKNLFWQNSEWVEQSIFTQQNKSILNNLPKLRNNGITSDMLFFWVNKNELYLNTKSIFETDVRIAAPKYALSSTNDKNVAYNYLESYKNRSWQWGWHNLPYVNESADKKVINDCADNPKFPCKSPWYSAQSNLTQLLDQFEKNQDLQGVRYLLEIIKKYGPSSNSGDKGFHFGEYHKETLDSEERYRNLRLFSYGTHQENQITSSQYLYFAVKVIRAGANLGLKHEADTGKIISDFLPIVVNDHYKRWVFDSKGVNGRYYCFIGDDNEGRNHFDHLTNKINNLYVSKGEQELTKYCNTIFDKDLWIIAGVAEMLALYQDHSDLFVGSATLDVIREGNDNDKFADQYIAKYASNAKENWQDAFKDYVKLGSSFIKSRLVETDTITDVYGNVIQGITLDGTGVEEWVSDYNYSDYEEDFPCQNIKVTKVDGKTTVEDDCLNHQFSDLISWDVSHARRLVHALNSLNDVKPILEKKDDKTDFSVMDFSQQIEGLAIQYFYTVFNQDFKSPRLNNYFDGSNGWYRVNYSNRYCTGYPPFAMSKYAVDAGFGMWKNYLGEISWLNYRLWDRRLGDEEEFRNTTFSGAVHSEGTYTCSKDSPYSHNRSPYLTGHYLLNLNSVDQ